MVNIPSALTAFSLNNLMKLLVVFSYSTAFPLDYLRGLRGQSYALDRSYAQPVKARRTTVKRYQLKNQGRGGFNLPMWAISVAPTPIC